jgi:hypothetical protein
MDSDTDSDTSSYSDISICKEIDELLTRMNQIHKHHIHALDSLESIHNLIKTHTNMVVTYKGQDQDFNTILEGIHEETMRQIEEGISVSFAKKIMKTLDQCIF